MYCIILVSALVGGEPPADYNGPDPGQIRLSLALTCLSSLKELQESIDLYSELAKRYPKQASQYDAKIARAKAVQHEAAKLAMKLLGGVINELWLQVKRNVVAGGRFLW